jgi:hypothetical protein
LPITLESDAWIYLFIPGGIHPLIHCLLTDGIAWLITETVTLGFNFATMGRYTFAD